MAASTHVDEWHGEDVSLDEVQERLGALRVSAGNGHSNLRTSVMTHTAWVPKSWLDAARGALAGLADAHPSRTILLVPDPDAERDAIDASVSVYCFNLESEADHVCSEVVELHLYGCRAESPASIIEPLLISDLPVFSRWRGRPPFGSRVLEEMVHVVDRLIVDSSEWDDVSGAYEELPKLLRPDRGLGHRVSPFAPLARLARRAVAGNRRRQEDRGHGAGGGRPAARRVAALAAGPKDRVGARGGGRAARGLDRR